MTGEDIPLFKDFSFYSEAETEKKRYQKVDSIFRQTYGDGPDFFSRAPGRVNLIGDHIDYNNFSVMPMAINGDMVVAAKAVDDGIIRLKNVDPTFEAEEFELPKNGDYISIDADHHSWGNYFKCSLRVAQEYIKENFPEKAKNRLQGLRLYFDGTVPTGGGLSSSAAICVASTLAVLAANGIKSVSKSELTRITAVSEHFVGVHNGGMDQCASIYGERNKAILIQFKPRLVGYPFQLPDVRPEMVFLVTNSLVKADKKASAPRNYNLRVVETSIAAELLASKFKLSLDHDSNLGTGTPRSFMDKYYEDYLHEPSWDGADVEIGIKNLEGMLQLTESLFSESQKKGMSAEEVAQEMGMSLEEFQQKFLNKFPVVFDKLKLYQRAKHVFAESLRVLQTLKLCRLYKPGQQDIAFLKNFGEFLNESHKSLDVLCDSTTPELNEIYNISLESGSYGARVTGAGFGGCMVHLTTVEKVPQLITALKVKYYKKHFPSLSEEELSNAIVVTPPAAGCCLVDQTSIYT